jgi:hypothetical protein
MKRKNNGSIEVFDFERSTLRTSCFNLHPIAVDSSFLNLIISRLPRGFDTPSYD